MQRECYQCLGCCLPTCKCHILPSLPQAHLCTSPCCCQVLLLVLCVSTEEEISGRNCPLWEDVRELWYLAVLDSHSGTHNMYQEYWDLTTAGSCHPVLTRHGAPGCPLNPHYKGGWRGWQIANAMNRQSGSAVTPRSSPCCPTGSFVASTRHASPPRGPTAPFRCMVSLAPGQPKQTPWEN